MNKLFELLGTDWKKYSLITILSSGISSFVAYNSTDRDKSLAEMNAYNVYVTDLLVLNKSPENRLKLAQYFSAVSPSIFSRRQWKNYAEIVYQEKLAFDKRNDSLVVLSDRFEIEKQTKGLSVADSLKYQLIKTQLGVINSLKAQELKGVAELKKETIITKKPIYIQTSGVSIDKAQKIASRLRELGYTVPGVENMSDEIGQKTKIDNSEIRYFNEEDQTAIQSLFPSIKDVLGDLKVNFNPRYGTAKNIEIWIK